MSYETRSEEQPSALALRQRTDRLGYVLCPLCGLRAVRAERARATRSWAPVCRLHGAFSHAFRPGDKTANTVTGGVADYVLYAAGDDLFLWVEIPTRREVTR